MSAETGSLLARINDALNRVIDPCSIGREVPAGLIDMGMVKSVTVEDAHAQITVRLTSPGCQLQTWFDERITTEVTQLPEIRHVDIAWSTVFDWSDDDMSEPLKVRLQHKRQAAERVREISLTRSQ